MADGKSLPPRPGKASKTGLEIQAKMNRFSGLTGLFLLGFGT
jgi:hypothetical protein